MKLTKEIRNQIKLFTQEISGYKAEEYGCPSGAYFCLQWTAENGDVWSSQAYQVRGIDIKEAMNHFWSFICKDN